MSIFTTDYTTPTFHKLMCIDPQCRRSVDPNRAIRLEVGFSFPLYIHQDCASKYDGEQLQQLYQGVIRKMANVRPPKHRRGCIWSPHRMAV